MQLLNQYHQHLTNDNQLKQQNKTRTPRPLNQTVCVFNFERHFNRILLYCETSFFPLATADCNSPPVSLVGSATSIIFVETKVWLRQAYFYCDEQNSIFHHDEHVSVMTKYVKSMLVTTKVLSRQTQIFVTTNMCLLQQNFCHDKNDTCGSSRQSYRRGHSDSTPSLGVFQPVIPPPPLLVCCLGAT